jgi:hypothetical protein
VKYFCNTRNAIPYI